MLLGTERCKITINLTNGLYVFGNKSATGKTRLYKELVKLKAYGNNVAAYTFNDKLLGHPIEDVLNSGAEVILLDRYDMYSGDGVEIIDQIKDKCVLLIDCKKIPDKLPDFEGCTIKMTRDSIEVS